MENEAEATDKKIIRMFEEAYEAHSTPTLQQNHMEGHLQGVAGMYQGVINEINKLKEEALQQAREWSMNGYNSNATIPALGGRRKTARKTHRRRRALKRKH